MAEMYFQSYLDHDVLHRVSLFGEKSGLCQPIEKCRTHSSTSEQMTSFPTINTYTSGDTSVQGNAIHSVVSVVDDGDNDHTCHHSGSSALAPARSGISGSARAIHS